MTKKLTYHMQATLDAIRAAGGYAEPEGGGWWRGADGRRLQYAPLATSTAAALGLQETVKTTTIYSLYDRGLLKRAGKSRERHRDTYIAAPTE